MIRYAITVTNDQKQVVFSADCSHVALTETLTALTRELQFTGGRPFYFEVKTYDRTD